MKKGHALLCCLIFGTGLLLHGCSVPDKLHDLITEEPDTGNRNEKTGDGYGMPNTGYDRDGMDYEIIVGEEIEDRTDDAAQDTQTVTRLCRNIRGLTEEELKAWEALGMNDRSVEKLQAEQEELFYYRMLNDEEKLIYAQMLMILKGVSENIIISETDEEKIDVVFQAVLADHPEIFYVVGYTYTKHILGDEVQRIGFSGTYTMTESEIEVYAGQIDSYVRICMQGLPDQDDYEKIKYLYEYVIEHTEYVLDAPQNQNILSVFLYGQSVCQGYAKAFEYLCRYAGIEATIVTGNIKESGYGHAWNLVNADGAYYYVDTTWGDASYTSGNDQDSMQLPSVNYEYLCVTTNQLSKTHEIRTVVQMPECVSIADNYYVREHAYFDRLDEEGLEAVFTAYDAGQCEYVTFKCASDEVYEAYYEYLIEEQHIFRYINSDAGVSYSVSDETDTFSFWIP